MPCMKQVKQADRRKSLSACFTDTGTSLPSEVQLLIQTLLVRPVESILWWSSCPL